MKFKLATENFKDLAIIPKRTNFREIKFGNKPPKNYHPQAGVSENQWKIIKEKISQKKATLVKIFKDKSQKNQSKKLWRIIRTMVDANASQPPVTAIVDDQGVANFDDATKAKITAGYLQQLFC